MIRTSRNIKVFSLAVRLFLIAKSTNTASHAAKKNITNPMDNHSFDLDL
jgi:hypothetical protein